MGLAKTQIQLRLFWPLAGSVVGHADQAAWRVHRGPEADVSEVRSLSGVLEPFLSGTEEKDLPLLLAILERTAAEHYQQYARSIELCH